MLRHLPKLTYITLALLPLGCGRTAYELGNDALGQGRYVEASAYFEVALSEGEAPLERVNRALASAHRAQAMTELDAGRCPEASAAFADAERTSPAALMDHEAVRLCLTTHPNNALERATLNRLVALGDRRAELKVRLLSLAREAGDDEALVRYVADLERAFSLTPEDRKEAAFALLRLGRQEEALPHITGLVAATPDDALLRLKLAELVEPADPGRAAALYEALARDFSSNPVVFLRYADFLTRRGDAFGARIAKERADSLRGIKPAGKRHLRPLKPSRR